MRDRLLGWAAFLLLASACLCSLVEHDTPWYLAAGDLILRTHGLPLSDPFSFTSSIPWLNHEWLAEVLLALCYRAGGFPSLVVLCALCVAIAIAILCKRRALVGAAPIVWVLCAFVLRETSSPRASLFSNLLFAATLALVLDDDDEHGARLWWCVPLQLVWTQVHGGNPLGVVLLGLRCLTGPSAQRAAVTIACALATIVGPYGWHVHEHFLVAHGALPMIREWQPLPLGAFGAPWVFVALAATAILASLRARDARSRFALAAVVLFAATGLRWARFSTEACILSAAVLAPIVVERTQTWRWRALGVPAAVAIAIALSTSSARQFGMGLAADRFPVAAVAWLRANHPPGPMFNSYNFGGYLLWARPEERVFVDGRAFTVYQPALLAEVPAVYADPRRFDALTERYGLRLAVLQRHGRGATLNAWLANQPRWHLVYEDAQAQIFVRAD